MVYKFVIEQNKKGEYVVKFKYNSELMFWIEGYLSKVGVRNVIELILKNGLIVLIEEE